MNNKSKGASLGQALIVSFICSLLAVNAWAAEVTYPTDAYTTGDTLSASGLNEKFNDIKAGVNDNNIKADTNATNIGTNTTNIDINASDITSLSTQLNNLTTAATPAAGDMQYWDGTAWVLVPAATKKSTLVFRDGKPVWEPTFFSIGDTGPAGGIVFYITDGGAHGLEATLTNQTSAAWGCAGTPIATNTAIGTGAQNTADIVANCADAGTAAKVADAYTLNGYNDWFLPSQDELDLLYVQRSVVGGFSGNYWSSSEFDSANAWVQFSSDGAQNYGNKSSLVLSVRAIRAF